MRIISGKFRGRKIISPKDNHVRPTSDRAREMIFNTLNSTLLREKRSLKGLTALDCFCGTGALGIEAISRGIEKVIFIDYSDQCLKICKENCDKFDINDKSEIIKIDLFNENHSKRFDKVDILFCDPPYKKFNIKTIIEKIGTLISQYCLIIIEGPKEKFSDQFNGYELIKIKYVSKSQFIFLKKI